MSAESRRQIGLRVMTFAGGAFGGMVGSTTMSAIRGESIPIADIAPFAGVAALATITGYAIWETAWKAIPRERRAAQAAREEGA